MENNINFIGADVHSKSVTFSIINKAGNLTMQETVLTSEKRILEFIESIRKPKYLTCEEGPMAQWMQNILYEKVDKFLICNPIKNALIYKGNSNDEIDSKDLAELLRLNALSVVNHPHSRDRQDFREIINLWFKIQKEITRTKNRLKSIFRMKAIPCTGESIYNQSKRKEWVEKLKPHIATKKIAIIYWKQLDSLNKEKEYLYKETKKYSKKFCEINEFLKIPGVGLITASTFSAFIFNPFRFENKSKLWAYCALSLEANDTGKEIDKKREKIRKRKIIKRLTNNGNRKLKSVLKSAAQTACNKCKDNELREKYTKCRANGMNYDSAILKVTRSLTSKLWGIWKEVEKEKNRK